MAYNFINPYNFIPLSNQCRRKFEDNRACFTGYMECELETLTPLIMMDTENVEYEGEHKIYNETFKIGGKPAIPGSELRGMIRSKFEALTSSCMSSVEEELEFVGRYKGNMLNAGLLDLTDPKDVKLYECEKVIVEDRKKSEFEKKRSGDFVTFISEDRHKNGKLLKNKGFKAFSKEGMQGYVKKGEECARVKAVHIFVNSGRKVSADNEENFYKMFLSCRDTTNENLGENHVTLVPEAITLDKYSEKSDKEILQPVWYEEVGKNVYFSLGQNGQVRYNKVLKDLIPEDFAVCKEINNLCEGCRVFGTVSGKNAASGKVRVEDAIMWEDVDDYYSKAITLQELSSPKFENARFYMYINSKEMPEDYQLCVDFKNKFKGQKNGTELFKSDKNIKIRGRKEYWHHEPEEMNKYGEADPTKRNCTVRPIKRGMKYTFKVYFNKLTKEQLEHLNMAVSLGNTYENESDYAHKLGHGKPLGYGSVRIRVKDIQCRRLEEKNGKYVYELIKYIPESTELFDAFPYLDKNPRVKQAMMNMYSFTYLKDAIKKDIKHKPKVEVDYPRQEKEGDIFEWFSNNKMLLPFADQKYDQLILHEKREESKNKKIGGKRK